VYYTELELLRMKPGLTGLTHVNGCAFLPWRVCVCTFMIARAKLWSDLFNRR